VNAWTVFLASYLLAVAIIIFTGCRRNAILRRQIQQTHYCRHCARRLLHLEKPDGICLQCEDEASGLPPMNAERGMRNAESGRLDNLHFRDPALEGADFGASLPHQTLPRAKTTPAPGRN
jgi:hypothetical protein